MPDRSEVSEQIIIGIKQTVIALKSGIVQEAIVAKDANDRMAKQIIQLP